jgi:hypothetical protein
MDETADSAADDWSHARNGSSRGFYRHNSNHSSASIFEDVEMAHDEVGCLWVDCGYAAVGS